MRLRGLIVIILAAAAPSLAVACGPGSLSRGGAAPTPATLSVPPSPTSCYAADHGRPAKLVPCPGS